MHIQYVYIVTRSLLVFLHGMFLRDSSQFYTEVCPQGYSLGKLSESNPEHLLQRFEPGTLASKIWTRNTCLKDLYPEHLPQKFEALTVERLICPVSNRISNSEQSNPQYKLLLFFSKTNYHISNQCCGSGSARIRI